MRYDQPSNTVEKKGEGSAVVIEKHEAQEVQQFVSEATDSWQQEDAELRAASDSVNDWLAFYRGFDTTFQATLADATSGAAEITSKAQAQAKALLRHTRDERAQLEAAIESLQQHSRLAQELNHTLSGLEQWLQAMAKVLRQTEEQIEQRMQIFHETATQLEDLRETVAEGHPKPEEEAIEERAAPEASQSVSKTQVRIIGLRQIARLHNIERTLKAYSAIEAVEVMQYTEGVLVLCVGHRSAPLSHIFKELPGFQVQEVHETEDGWIEVHLDGADADSRTEA